MNPADKLTLRKAHQKYDKAAAELCAIRDKLFPAGCEVISMGWKATVRAGSLYPHQVLTDRGHFGISGLVGNRFTPYQF